MFNLENLVNQKFESIKEKFDNTALNFTGTFSTLFQKNDTAANVIADIKINVTNATTKTTIGAGSLKLCVNENIETKVRTFDNYFDYTLTNNSIELPKKACFISSFESNITKSMHFLCDFNPLGKELETYSTRKEFGLSDTLIINAGSDLDVAFNMSYTAKNLVHTSDNFETFYELQYFIQKNAALNSLAESLKTSFDLSTITRTKTTSFPKGNLFKDFINVENLDKIFFNKQILGFSIEDSFFRFRGDYKIDEHTSVEVFTDKIEFQQHNFNYNEATSEKVYISGALEEDLSSN